MRRSSALLGLLLVACLDVTAVPTPTAVVVTPTPDVTPTETAPSATSAPETSFTPENTQTPTPEPTATPEPTHAPTPTETPEPTASLPPTPTATADPLAWTPTPIGEVLQPPDVTPIGGVPVTVIGSYRVVVNSLTVRTAPLVSTSTLAGYTLRYGETGAVYEMLDDGSVWLCISSVYPCRLWIASVYQGARLADFLEGQGGGGDVEPLPSEGDR